MLNFRCLEFEHSECNLDEKAYSDYGDYGADTVTVAVVPEL